MNAKVFFFSLSCYVSLLHRDCKAFFLEPIHSHTTMSFSTMLNMPDISGPTNFGLMDSVSLNTASTPTTFFGGSLLSPATISREDISTPVTSTGSEGRENGAYIQLWRRYQQCEQELVKTKQELDCLKYVFFLPLGMFLTSYIERHMQRWSITWLRTSSP